MALVGRKLLIVACVAMLIGAMSVEHVAAAEDRGHTQSWSSG